MNEDYKILEFKGKASGTIFKLKENGSYSPGSNKYSEYSKSEMLFDHSGSVKSFDFEVIKVQKTNGEILEIGNEIFNSATGNNYYIKRFSLRSKEIMIQYNDSNSYLTIRNSSLVNYKPIQQEIQFKEPIDGYTLEQIEQVLLKALDKPEVDAIIIDFKRLKDNNDVIVSEEPKEDAKGVLMSDEEKSWEDYNYSKSKTILNVDPYSASKANVKQLRKGITTGIKRHPVFDDTNLINKTEFDILEGLTFDDIVNYEGVYAEKLKKYKSYLYKELTKPVSDECKVEVPKKLDLPFLSADKYDDLDF